MVWNRVIDLPESITSHYIWTSGMLAIKHQYNQLTYSDIQRQIHNWDRCDDLTKGEAELKGLLQEELNKFNDSWEF